MINYSILPLDFGEFLFFNGMSPDDMDSHKQVQINRIFDRYLVYGGFPELFDAGELERKGE